MRTLNSNHSSTLTVQRDHPSAHSISKRWALYFELSKARLSALVVITTMTGFLLACQDSLDSWLFFWTTLGTACTAFGANSFNQWWELYRDSRMERTRKRPIPTGQITRRNAFFWALLVSATGIAILSSKVNFLTAFLALSNILLYVLVYTPLKPISSLCTLVGAVCGAIPPMMGWTAVTGHLGYGAWLLGATLFIWQIPHFLSLAWLYRDDYARGGFRMLPITDQRGQITCQVILLYSLALLPLGLAYTLGGLTGYLFLAGSIALGGYFFLMSIRLYLERTDTHARQLFFASIIYLPLLMGIMIADRALRMPTRVSYPTFRSSETIHSQDTPVFFRVSNSIHEEPL